MEFPERLRSLIDEKGIDVKTFVREFNAANLGVTVSESNMSSLLRGKTECKYGTIIALAKYFNVTTDYLLGMTDTRTVDMSLKEACETIGLDANLLQNMKSISNNRCYKKYMAVINFLIMEYCEKHYIDYRYAPTDNPDSIFPRDTLLENLAKVIDGIAVDYTGYDVDKDNDFPKQHGTFGDFSADISYFDFKNILFNGLSNCFRDYSWRHIKKEDSDFDETAKYFYNIANCILNDLHDSKCGTSD